MRYIGATLLAFISYGVGGKHYALAAEDSSSDTIEKWRDHLVSDQVVGGTGLLAAMSLAYFIYWLRNNDTDLKPADFIQHDAFFLDHPEIQEFREKLVKQRVPHFRFLDWATGASLVTLGLGAIGMAHLKMVAPKRDAREGMPRRALVAEIGLLGLILNRTVGYRITQNKYVNWMLNEVDKEIKQWTPKEDTALLPEMTIEIFENEKKNFERVKEQIREALLALAGRTHILHGLPIRYNNGIRLSKKYEKLANVLQYDNINVDQMRYIWDYTAGRSEKLNRAEKLHRVSWGLCLLSAIQTIKIRCQRLERMARMLQERNPQYNTGIAAIIESAEGRIIRQIPREFLRNTNEESPMYPQYDNLPPLTYPQHNDQSLLYSQQPSMQPLPYEQPMPYQQPLPYEQPIPYQQPTSYQQPIRNEQPIPYQQQMQNEGSYTHPSLRSGLSDEKQREESPNHYNNEYYPQSIESNA